MTITAEQVKQLRDMTGAGMMECKKALSETNGDLNKAIDALRTAGIAKAEKRADRAASQGRIESYIHDNRIGVLIEVNCETDFVARTDDFIRLCKDLGMQAAAANADYVRREEVPAERLDRERAIYADQVKNDGKPAHMVDKIVDGKLNKFYSEVCLMEQAFIKKPDMGRIPTMAELADRFGHAYGLEGHFREWAKVPQHELDEQIQKNLPGLMTPRVKAEVMGDPFAAPPAVAASAMDAAFQAAPPPNDFVPMTVPQQGLPPWVLFVSVGAVCLMIGVIVVVALRH